MILVFGCMLVWMRDDDDYDDDDLCVCVWGGGGSGGYRLSLWLNDTNLEPITKIVSFNGSPLNLTPLMVVLSTWWSTVWKFLLIPMLVCVCVCVCVCVRVCVCVCVCMYDVFR